MANNARYKIEEWERDYGYPGTFFVVFERVTDRFFSRWEEIGRESTIEKARAFVQSVAQAASFPLIKEQYDRWGNKIES